MLEPIARIAFAEQFCSWSAWRIPRTAGWLAQWLEGVSDPEQKIARPRQLYTGADERPYAPIDERRAARFVAVS